MTAEVRVSVPDDVADWLKRQSDASAAVTEAVRAQIRAAQIDEVLRAAGVEPPGAGERWSRPPPGQVTVLAEGRRMLADRLAPGPPR
jgi:hypothetical protein